MTTPNTLARVRALPRDEKLALYAAAVTTTQVRRRDATTLDPHRDDGSTIVTLRRPNAPPLRYRLSADDMML